MIIKICLICGKEFRIKPYEKDKAKFCSYKCYWKSKLGKIPWNKGKKEIRKEVLENLKKSHIGKKQSFETIEKRMCNMRGKNSPSWKGGINPINDTIRKSLKYKQWRKKIFERDNYTCWICEQGGEKLHSHHLKKFSDYPKLRFVVSNGLTLCEFCHKTYTKFGNSKKDSYPTKCNKCQVKSVLYYKQVMPVNK